MRKRRWWDLSGRKDEDEAVGDGGGKLLGAEHSVTGCRRKWLFPQVWPWQVAGILQSQGG